MGLNTAKDAERAQLEILRRMSPSQRLEIALDLTATARGMLAQGVRQRRPEYTEEEVGLAVIRLLIPEQLFIRAYPRGLSRMSRMSRGRSC